VDKEAQVDDKERAKIIERLAKVIAEADEASGRLVALGDLVLELTPDPIFHTDYKGDRWRGGGAAPTAARLREIAKRTGASVNDLKRWRASALKRKENERW
jgi:hypothetical protein